jgi:hypothetical protein
MFVNYTTLRIAKKGSKEVDVERETENLDVRGFRTF